MQKKIIGIISILVVFAIGAIYASWTGTDTLKVGSGNTLLSSKWNAVIDNLEELKTTLTTYAANFSGWKENLKVNEGDLLTSTLWNDTQDNIELLKQNIPNNAIKVYGDENPKAVAACKKWIADNLGSKGGNNSWVWVPARYANAGEVATNTYYEKPVEDENGVNYICKGFAVAKYEMSYSNDMAANSTGGGEDWNTVHYTGTPSDNGGIVSMAGRYPIADITQPQAISACSSMGMSIHLITNDEWMTIARNIEQQATNWSGGGVGNGYISNGVSGVASIGCGNEGTPTTIVTTKTIYTSLARNRATKTGGGFGNTACDEKRKLTLSNGEIIWDFAGNVWEHVNKANTIIGSNFNNGQTTIAGCSPTSAWDDTANGCWDTSPNRGTYGPATAGGTDKGFGNVHYSQGVASNIFLRGGSADDGLGAGVFALYLSRAETGQAHDVGARCVL